MRMGPAGLTVMASIAEEKRSWSRAATLKAVGRKLPSQVRRVSERPRTEWWALSHWLKLSSFVPRSMGRRGIVGRR